MKDMRNKNGIKGGNMKKTFKLENLTCPSCGNKIETAIKKLNGVKDASVLYNASKCKVEYDEDVIKAEEIANVIEDLGYDIIG